METFYWEAARQLWSQHPLPCEFYPIPHKYISPKPHLYLDRDLDKSGGLSWLRAVRRYREGWLLIIHECFGEEKDGTGGLRYQELQLEFPKCLSFAGWPRSWNEKLGLVE